MMAHCPLNSTVEDGTLTQPNDFTIPLPSWSQSPPPPRKCLSRPQPLWVPNSTQNPRPHSRAESRSASHWARSNGGSSHEYYILEKRSNTDFRFAAIITSS